MTSTLLAVGELKPHVRVVEPSRRRVRGRAPASLVWVWVGISGDLSATPPSRHAASDLFTEVPRGQDPSQTRLSPLDLGRLGRIACNTTGSGIYEGVSLPITRTIGLQRRSDILSTGSWLVNCLALNP